MVAKDCKKQGIVVEVVTKVHLREDLVEPERSPGCKEKEPLDPSTPKSDSVSSSSKSETRKHKGKKKKEKKEKKPKKEKKEKKVKREKKMKVKKPHASDSSESVDPIVDVRNIYKDGDDELSPGKKKTKAKKSRSTEPEDVTQLEPQDPGQLEKGTSTPRNEKTVKSEKPVNVSLDEIPLPPSPVVQPARVAKSTPQTVGRAGVLTPSPASTVTPCHLFLPRSVKAPKSGHVTPKTRHDKNESFTPSPTPKSYPTDASSPSTHDTQTPQVSADNSTTAVRPDSAWGPHQKQDLKIMSSTTAKYYSERESSPHTLRGSREQANSVTMSSIGSDSMRENQQVQDLRYSLTRKSNSEREGSPRTSLSSRQQSDNRRVTPVNSDYAREPAHRRLGSRFSSSTPRSCPDRDSSPHTPVSSLELSYNVPVTPLGASHASYCLKCFEEGHHIRTCRNPKRCRVCRVLGHYAGSRKCEYYTEDPNIIAFQGAGDILSNFFPCRIQLWGMIFHSSEQAYQWRKAVLWHMDQIADQIMAAPTARDVKLLCSRALRGPPGNHDELKLSVMREVLQAKAFCVPAYAELLMRANPLTVFGEATTDVFWATGLTREETQRTAAARWPGKNVLGQLHREVVSALQRGELVQYRVKEKKSFVDRASSSADTSLSSDTNLDSESENRSDKSSRRVRKHKRASHSSNRSGKSKKAKKEKSCPIPHRRGKSKEKRPKKRRITSSNSSSDSDTKGSKRKALKDRRNKMQENGGKREKGSPERKKRKLEESQSLSESATDA